MRTMTACARTLGARLPGSQDQYHEILISPGTFTSPLNMTARGPAGPDRPPAPGPASRVRPSDSGMARGLSQQCLVPGRMRVRPITASRPRHEQLISRIAERLLPPLSRRARLRHLGPRPPPGPARPTTLATRLSVTQPKSGRQHHDIRILACSGPAGSCRHHYGGTGHPGRDSLGRDQPQLAAH